ncbi:uncharacterized protein EV422DRAFT_535615 [Fimicolochytrium jonesii]|uniref:uncharacterized protein n=1 Tax=Fimicolochytrium jonesii TaxID=1396493 RepID=UPI0022FE3385|nr:uncharacterized protein EV422DRAFT_535615 [Fimicolochytrium jonesii]KAI8819221.1 hypothetical protein EV422DRAFT_535615 [Fimicolochytrium jonesii]
MADPMDLSLDDIIASNRPKRRTKQGNGVSFASDTRRSNNYRSRSSYDRPDGRGSGGPRRENKPYARRDLEGQWKHDMFGDSRGGSGAGLRDSGRVGRSTAAEGATITIKNLHWNVTQEDIAELMGTQGAVNKIHFKYDNAGRSLGECEVTFDSARAAQSALDTYDGRELDGQAMTVELIGGGSRQAGRGAVGSSLADRLGPKQGSSIVDRLGQKLEDRLGPRLGAKVGGQSNGGGPDRNGRGNRGRGGRTGVGRAPRKGPATMEDLDAQMERYMSGEPEPEPVALQNGKVDWDKPADTGARGIITYDDIDTFAMQ